jgi:Raf kinase inhibitor-like YbhB/YbcL family protein
MKLWSASFEHDQPIPEEYAFARYDAGKHFALSRNRSPDLQWSGEPEGTRSFALVVLDSDVPTVADDVNQEGREVPQDLPRTDFAHWTMVDIPRDCHAIPEGSCSAGITVGGKKDPPGPAGSRQGLNDYTGWFAADEDMKGRYLGYDGPGPPWNDARIHRYHFTLYALELDRLPLEGDFSASEVLAAIEGHILDQATLTGTYTLNPRLRG